MNNKTWYVGSHKDSLQGLVIDEETGKNIAVSYETSDASVIATAPELVKFAQDIIRYLEAGEIRLKSDRRFVINRAIELLNKAEQPIP